MNHKVACAECGFESHILVRHLKTDHDMDAAAYLAKHADKPLWSAYGLSKIQQHSTAAKAAQIVRPRKTVTLRELFPDFEERYGVDMDGEYQIFAEPGPLTPKLDPHYVFPMEETIDALVIIRKAARNRVYMKGWSGCLAGSTMVEVNRGGKSFKTRLDTLVMMENRVPVKPGPAWDPAIQTKIRSRDPKTGAIRLFDLTAAVYSGIRETYRVTFEDGRRIRGTATHPFLTTTGWRTLRELSVGMFVHVDGGTTDNGRNKPQYLTRRIGEVREPTHRLMVEADMNGLGLEDYVSRLRAGGTIVKRLSDEQIVHHKNGDTRDNRLSNLEVYDDQAEHARRHGRESSWQNVTAVTVPLMITAIEEYKAEPTFDLTVAGPENFLANGITVHNTGKTAFWFNLAAKLNAEVMEWNADSFQQRGDLIGRMQARDGATYFQYGILPLALQRGCWLVVNEFDTISPLAANILKPMLEDPPRLTILENNAEVVHGHPDFRIIATANTWARGDSTGMFINTHTQSDADARRWSARILLNYMDEASEIAMLRKYFPTLAETRCQKLVRVANKVRDAFKAGKIDKTLSPAELVVWAENWLACGKGVHHAARISFLNALEADAYTAIEEMVNAVFSSEKTVEEPKQ